jgi:hypothetical protein
MLRLYRSVRCRAEHATRAYRGLKAQRGFHPVFGQLKKCATLTFVTDLRGPAETLRCKFPVLFGGGGHWRTPWLAWPSRNRIFGPAERRLNAIRTALFHGQNKAPLGAGLRRSADLGERGAGASRYRVRILNAFSRLRFRPACFHVGLARVSAGRCFSISSSTSASV